jgi:hypothetical protein
MTATTDTPSARIQVRTWVREQIADADEVTLPALADEAVEHFVKDKRFIRALLDESLRPLVYDLARIEMGRTRGTVIRLGDTLATEEAIDKRSQTLAGKWSRWLEHVNDRHVRLLDMTREDLLTAAGERRERAEADLKIADLWDRLAAHLEGGQAVRERFTPQEIDAMHEKVIREGIWRKKDTA